MNLEESYKIGYVSKTHGLHGEVTIVLLPECPDLTNVRHLFASDGGALVPYFIEAISFKGDKAFVRFEDVNHIDQAAALKGFSLYLPKVDRPKLGRGEFYNDEVVGFEVMEGSTLLGSVMGIVEAGPSRYLSIDHHGKEVLIPVNGPFIKSINKTKKRVTVELPEGYLDI